MRVAVDNDFFIKTEVCRVAELFLSMLGTSRADSLLLPSLVAQLRKPKSKLYKAHATDAPFLLGQAKLYGSAPDGSLEWLERLRDVHDIDAGEAQLLALVAGEPETYLLATHDKRCIRAVKSVPGLCAALEGRVVMLETALQKLCDCYGFALINDCIGAAATTLQDTTIKACFGSGLEERTIEALNYYVADVERSTDVRILWRG